MPPRIALISLYSYHAFGVRSLYSVLRASSIDASLIFYGYFSSEMRKPSAKEIRIITRLLKDLSVDVTGISVPSTFMKTAAMLTQEIKNNLNIPVIWGGPHPTISPQECIRHTDLLLRGEAEESLLQLMRSWDSPEKISTPGLWLKYADKIVSNNSVPIFPGLDSLPLPDFGQEHKYCIENGRLITGDPIYNPQRLSGISNDCYHTVNFRGCPFNCSYCGNQAVKSLCTGQENFIRKRCVSNFINELKYARDALNPEYFVFEDACFGSDKEWLREFCIKYPQELSVPFYCEMHPSLADEETVKSLAKAGMCNTLVGIQSGSEKTRNVYFGRMVSATTIYSQAQILKKYKIGTHYEIITDNPLEADADKQETLKMLLKLPRPLNIHVFSLNFLPGTDITRQTLDSGVISESDVEGRADNGAKRFLLNHPRKGKDIFWNYLYFFASDCFCVSQKTPGMRKMLSEKFILRLSDSRILRLMPGLMQLLEITISALNRLRREAKFIYDTLRLPVPENPVLAMHVLIASFLTPPLIAALGPKKLLKLTNGGTKKTDASQKRVCKIVGYVNFLMCRRPWRNLKNYCYVRSLILYYFLNKAGLAVKINFGVKDSSRKIKGHGWLTLNNKIYLDDEKLCRDFKVVYSYPE